ncbi:carbon-nitrogen hydrolase [Alicyclobacillus sacchari]|uniref:nitrilase-related carbon-nitrogen hydrolase n=1 Tax=Alicyclobacillus sacchari TaxID=392010 RepID=UPI0023EA4A0C|nr:nitrilase-related carbon-nitrogen hydrolase [Alicyclobacillus sacchari]GMA56293.1 carbon-nitrogen hydrolase [Alicyclobacillus sacchari]
MASDIQRVAIAQIAPKLGDLGANLERHHEYIREASAQGAQLIVFPELGLTGYQTQDLTLEVARSATSPEIQSIVDQSREIDVLFSFVEETQDHLFYVTALYASQGKVVHKHRKVYLPTYGMFDERRYFAPGDRFDAYASSLGTASILICEDAWHLSAPYLLAMQQATLLLVPASSPWRNTMAAAEFGSHAFWRHLLQMYAQLLGVHIVFANRVGYEDGVHFYGGSGVVAPNGSWLVEAATAKANWLSPRSTAA